MLANMKLALSMLILVGLASPLVADSIQVEYGYIKVSVGLTKAPYDIGGVVVDSASKAASLLDYIEKNWPEDLPQTILVEYKSKRVLSDDDPFEAALSKMAKSSRWKIIRLPVPRGTFSASWGVWSTLAKKWADQAATSDR